MPAEMGNRIKSRMQGTQKSQTDTKDKAEGNKAEQTTKHYLTLNYRMIALQDTASVPLAIYRIQMFILLTSAGWGTQLNSTFAVYSFVVLAVVMIGLASCDSARQNVEEIGNLPTSSSAAYCWDGDQYEL